MDCVSPILDVATRLWDCTSQRAVYARKLGGNLNILKSKMEELNNLSKDVMEKVEREEELQQSRRTHEVDGWLQAVQSMGAEVEGISRNGDQEIQKKCLRLCPKNCWSNYKLGKIVIEKIDEVTELMGKGHFDVVTHSLPFAPTDERPMGKTVGLDLMFEKVQKCLVDEQVRSIGLFGMGGVGKTTLLQKINNDFFAKRSDFDVVIWVVVSRPVNIEHIQEVILKKFKVADDVRKSSSKEEKAAQIFRLLKEKNFAILLDDMWGHLDLLEVGIPPLNDHTKSKVLVLTTRSEQVCDAMGVHHKFRVECLTTEQAFSLFCDNVGENILKSHPDIKRLAKIIVEECKGLPLTLIVVGRSMTSRKTPREWEKAIELLQSYPTKISGMGDQVFPILKFSYDHLGNNITKSCFLHCSIFPEDYIYEEDIINLWIGEGLLSECYDTYEAQNQGEEIIRNLKLACLLENCKGINRFKMHDVIRDMGQWILCDHGEEKQKKFVVECFKIIKAFEIARWDEAQWILLWHSYFKEEKLCVSPCFPNLRTFIFRHSVMKSLPIGFFGFMPNIRVLDLSDNENLEELPLEICRLESLEYLNLARTGVNKLPEELKELKKLRFLILDEMYVLQAIPPDVISCLLNLQMFNMTILAECLEGYKECLQELEHLPCLSEINISLDTSFAYKIFLNSQKLQKCTQSLNVRVYDGQGFLVLPILTLQRLKSLLLHCCFKFEGVKIDKKSDQEEQRSMCPFHISNSYFHNLVTLIVTYSGFVDSTWLIYAHCLERLLIQHCNEMEEIIGADGESEESEIEEEDHTVFSRLSILHLRGLPKLKSIYRRPLSFPSLTEISIIQCPNLRKLPMSSDSATATLKTIKGELSACLATAFKSCFQLSENKKLRKHVWFTQKAAF